MIFQPKAIFFDWDHTLWDHDANASQSLSELFHQFDLDAQHPGGFDSFFTSYQLINNFLWEEYQFGRISQEELRATRFQRIFEQMNLEGDYLKFGDLFLEITPRKSQMIEGAIEIIERLNSKYPLFVLTNGFSDVQDIKITGSGIKHHFEGIITSQEAQAKKPDPAFFQYALNLANSKAEEVLMIGDHEKIDVWGAEQVGIPAIHLNELGVESQAKRQIRKLKELENWIVI